MNQDAELRRVVITGIGLVTPLGIGVEETWNGILEGQCGIGNINRFDPSEFDCKIAAEVKNFDPTQFMEKKEARHADLFMQFATAATRMALEQSGLTIDETNAERVGVQIGSGIGGLTIMEQQVRIMVEKGPGRVSPFTVPMMIGDMASGFVSIITGAKGPNLSAITACATGANAIGDAYHIIRRGDADVMITGGTESPVTPLAVAAFHSARALCASHNEDPAHASRPFDASRDGFVIAEGAGVVILEALHLAKARGANILGEIVGYGMTGDAFHITQPHNEGDGAMRAMKMALNNARVLPEQVDYINAHGTSTPLNDKYETLAIKRTFGDHAYKIPISSTKSMIGHLLGAAGAVEAIFCLLAMRDSMIPPTINYQTPDPDCDLDYVPNQKRSKEINYALSNSFGFGGHNIALLLKKYAD